VSGIFFTAHGIANPSPGWEANRFGMRSESVKKIPDTFSFPGLSVCRLRKKKGKRP
jgi:hypothetical protein